ncbi:MAG: PTPA-CTERM sorting domain-containing protein [Leptolyngbya sp. LCM1.Bin17]|nr:MAG: PTPA-CTERM sorting domain-containing protein [Leptolyngbya sp. LCM1.Bin17]
MRGGLILGGSLTNPTEESLMVYVPFCPDLRVLKERRDLAEEFASSVWGGLGLPNRFFNAGTNVNEKRGPLFVPDLGTYDNVLSGYWLRTDPFSEDSSIVLAGFGGLQDNGLDTITTFATARAVLNDPIVDFSDNPISFNFEETVGEVEIQDPPIQTPQANGFSIDELSYLLTSQSTNPISFSWSASRDFSFSGGSDIFASILGSTSLKLAGGLPTNLEFFVEGYIDNQASPFARFSVDNLVLTNGIEFPLDWNITEVVTGLTPDTHTLGIVSGIQWTPSAVGETLLISSQYGGRATPVPTPALLPGLIGMGVAALRKRKGEGDESAEA